MTSSQLTRRISVSLCNLCVTRSLGSACSSKIYLNNWNEEKKRDKNPTKFGPLTNRPDYSFVDGRPVPLGFNMYKRLRRQMSYAEKIVTLTKQVTWAKENYKIKLQEEAKAKQQIIENKLKQKGNVQLD